MDLREKLKFSEKGMELVSKFTELLYDTNDLEVDEQLRLLTRIQIAVAAQIQKAIG